MSRPILPSFALLAAVACIPACQSNSPATQFPPPVNGQQEVEGMQGNTEEENQEKRRQWMEEMHLEAPGVDWRSIEAENAMVAAERKFQARMNRSTTAGTWTEVGSRDQAGNTKVAVPTEDLNTLYVGSALGGLFRGGIDGSNWTPLSDHVYGGVDHLAVLPGSGGAPDILVRGSGTRVRHSTDEGVTWVISTGLSGLVETKRLLMLDDSQHTLLLLGRANGWKLFRSEDGGVSFQQMRDMAGFNPDIWTPRDVLGPVYLLESNQLSSSTDKGTSFTAMGVAAPFTSNNVLLGGHEADSGNTFSMAVYASGAWQLWRTTDAGLTWTHPSDLPGMWGSAFCTGTQTTKMIAYGGVDMYISRDSGVSFSLVNSWSDYYGDPASYLHADIMSISAMPDATSAKGERWFINTHGGTYQSMDRMRTVENLSLSGLGVSQYYSSLTSRRDAKYLAVGSQDQGYQRGIVGTPSGSGPYVDLPQLISGDYGHLSSTDGSHDLVYCDYPGFVLIQEGEVNPILRTADFPSGFSGQWLPYMIADPIDKRAFYLCGKKLWRYQRQGNVWTPTQHTTHDFVGTLSSLVFSPLDPQRAWCCTTTGTIFYSTDGAVTWTESLDTGPGSHSWYGSTLVASSTNVNEVWIAGSSSTPVRFSSDGGVTWGSRSQGMPWTFVYCLVEGADGSGSMYAGTQSGAWEWDPIAQQWSDILGADGPLTLYWAVEAVPSTNTIRFSTYGRGVWDYQPGTPGFFPYGELRGEPNILNLRADAQPLIGTNVTLSISGGPASSSGYLVVCGQPDDSIYLGGALLVDLATKTQQLQLTTDTFGDGQVVVPIPNTPSLIGTEHYLQAAVLDATQPGGWAMSHGLRALIGE